MGCYDVIMCKKLRLVIFSIGDVNFGFCLTIIIQAVFMHAIYIFFNLCTLKWIKIIHLTYTVRRVILNNWKKLLSSSAHHASMASYKCFLSFASRNLTELFHICTRKLNPEPLHRELFGWRRFEMLPCFDCSYSLNHSDKYMPIMAKLPKTFDESSNDFFSHCHANSSDQRSSISGPNSSSLKFRNPVLILVYVGHLIT